MNVATGEVLHDTKARHSSKEVLDFFTFIDASVAKELDVHVVLDNLSAHKAAPIAAWLHVRTSNMIESTFATLRHRTKRVKGAFSKDSALAMMLQLGLEAQERWRRITVVERLGELIQGVRFVDGVAQLAVAA